MAFTNSYHSSARGHSIKNAAKLAGCQRHNSRGYQAWDYSAGKIVGIIGEPENLSSDVRDFINETFAGAKARYNEKQNRAERRITCSPFEHFNNSKKLDIAVESILQVADQEFWSRFRTDETVIRKGKEYVRHSFPGEVQEAMNELFRKQLEAYEKIYVTHGAEILQKVEREKALCERFLSTLGGSKCDKYEDIRTSKPRDRDCAIEALTEVEQEEYATYSTAINTLQSIESIRLIDRIRNNQMHIKVVNATGHYDEFSPHAHAVSVCWAEGFQSGLDTHVAKSIVLNRWALEVIQDRMHEIAQEEIDKHPEIFKGRELDEKQEGRNSDYSKEYYLRRQVNRLDVRAQLMARSIGKTADDIGEHFDKLVAEEVANVIDSPNLFNNAMFLLSRCSDERFEELSEEGRRLKAEMMPEEIPKIDPLRDGLEAAINQIMNSDRELTWESQQEAWKPYKEASEAFWTLRDEAMRRIREEKQEAYNARSLAYMEYQEAMRLLDSSRTLIGFFIALMMVIKAEIGELFAELKITSLEAERDELRKNTATFAEFSRKYREDLKRGKAPWEGYLDAMTDIVKILDKEHMRFEDRLQAQQAQQAELKARLQQKWGEHPSNTEK